MALQKDDDSIIFALDIGTRKVAGLLVEVDPDGRYRLVSAEVEEHNTRAMQDGQIHDVVEVAKLIRVVKGRLEKRTGRRLDKVAVAAAGRALKTENGRASREVSPLDQIRESDVLSLELAAVLDAQKKILSDSEVKKALLSDRHHCVGYTATQYELDGSVIGSLIGQRGESIAVEVIATFLPRIVVDSLCAAVEQAGLEVASVTLEPIAAISVAIPPNMRQLNLALVDVGAGTSDIAITSAGRITAYGMVPFAGDEITEELCSRYLLDFQEGERVKRSLSKGGRVKFTDVLGVEQEVESADILAQLDAKVDSLAESIVDRIVELNGREPQAVICIGGGSLTPGLTDKIAARLGVSSGRVAVRGREIVKEVLGRKKSLEGPMAVTPIGIAVTSRSRNTLGFFPVKVNGHVVRVMDLNEPTIADALIASGISIRQLHGRPGQGMTVTVNGAVRTIKGTMGKPARILCNGAEASLDASVKPGDELEITAPEDGEPGKAKIRDLVQSETIEVTYEGEKRSIVPVITRNGLEAGLDTDVADNDTIIISTPRTVAEVAAALDGPDNSLDHSSICYTVNGQQRTAVTRRRVFTVNSVKVGRDQEVRAGDRIESTTEPAPVTVSDVLAEVVVDLKPFRVIVNGAEVVLFDGCASPRVLINGVEVAYDREIGDGDEVTVEIPHAPQFILADVLRHSAVASIIEKMRSEGRGSIRLSVNGGPANFSTTLNDGDRVSISFIQV